MGEDVMGASATTLPSSPPGNVAFLPPELLPTRTGPEQPGWGPHGLTLRLLTE